MFTEVKYQLSCRIIFSLTSVKLDSSLNKSSRPLVTISDLEATSRFELVEVYGVHLAKQSSPVVSSSCFNWVENTPKLK